MVLRAIILCALLTLPAATQLKERKEAPLKIPQGMVDEDEDRIQEPQYAFNPIQAEKEMKVGDFYARKGSHRAAAGRYREATRWNPSLAEAWFKLGDSREELGDLADAISAYRRYLDLESEGNDAKKARKRIAALERKLEKLPASAQEEDDPSEALDSLPESVLRRLER